MGVRLVSMIKCCAVLLFMSPARAFPTGQALYLWCRTPLHSHRLQHMPRISRPALQWRTWQMRARNALAPKGDTLGAVERCGTCVTAYGQKSYRVTASDVAAAGGYELESARASLTLLAAAVGLGTGDELAIFTSGERGQSSPSGELRNGHGSVPPTIGHHRGLRPGLHRG